MLEKLKNIENLIFVGSFALYKHGIVEKYNDFDIVILDPNDIPELILYDTDSKFSKSGKRGCLIKEETKIDAFIENSLPEFEVIDGFKCQTIKSMREYYENIYNFVHEHWRPQIDAKLKLLT